jgi:hypothetical protein
MDPIGAHSTLFLLSRQQQMIGAFRGLHVFANQDIHHAEGLLRFVITRNPPHEAESNKDPLLPAEQDVI